MSIETDESLWPEGAQFYIKQKPNNGAFTSFFARTCGGDDTAKCGVNLSGAGYHVYLEYWEVIPRQTAQWPQVGVECEYNPCGLGNWEPCKVIGRYEGFVWLATSGGPFTAPSNKIEFRPLRTLRDELLDIFAKETIPSNEPIDKVCDYISDAVDTILAEFDLTRKQK